MKSVRMTSSLAYSIKNTIIESMYPNEIRLNLIKAMTNIWDKYVSENFHIPSNIATATISFDSENKEYLRMIDYETSVSFNGFFVATPFTKISYCGKGPLDIYMEIDIDRCPLTELKLYVDELVKFNTESAKCKDLLITELRQTTTVGGFIKRFPRLAWAVQKYLPEEIVDLPELVQIDFDEINDMIVAE